MRPYKCPHHAYQEAFTRRESLKRHQKKHSSTVEDAVPQLSPGYASPEVDQLDWNPAVPLPCDGLLTPESIGYTSVVELPCYGRVQKHLEVSRDVMATQMKVIGVHHQQD